MTAAAALTRSGALLPESTTVANAAVRILIVAGYAAVRAGLHALLAAPASEASPISGATLEFLGEVDGAGDELSQLLPYLRPDVVLLDTSGDNASFARTLGGILRAGPDGSSNTALVVLGDNPQSEVPRLTRAALPGWGYLLRSEADTFQITSAVRAAAAGLVTLDRSISLSEIPWAGPSSSRPGLPDADGTPGETLTAREVEVLQLMAEGLPNKQIGTRLGISLHTVKFHVAQILGKLGATSRTEAVTLGARRGYVVL